jgi:hypothetical protein
MSFVQFQGSAGLCYNKSNKRLTRGSPGLLGFRSSIMSSNQNYRKWVWRGSGRSGKGNNQQQRISTEAFSVVSLRPLSFFSSTRRRRLPRTKGGFRVDQAAKASAPRLAGALPVHSVLLGLTGALGMIVISNFTHRLKCAISIRLREPDGVGMA